MRFREGEGGFSLIEVLVAIALFSIVSVTFYTALFSGVRGGNTTRNVVTISGEARAGFTRMVRDTREAERISAATPTSYNVKVDFNNDGQYDNPTQPTPAVSPTYLGGDYEDLTFSYDADEGTIELNDVVLMDGVEPINGVIFSYSSNILEYDWNRDGVTTWQELDVASNFGVAGVGNRNNVLDEAELPFISNINYSLRVSEGDRSSTFFTEAELRNRS